MQESRMMAEVAPPGCCAMPKVSGRRMATPLAPPRPGSTPMMTPSTTPVNISTRFISVIATPKPWISDWISSIAPPSIQPEPAFARPFGKRHLEPDLAKEEENHRNADAHHRGLRPGVLAEPAHEQADEDRRRDVDAEPGDGRDVDRRRHQHHQHHPQLADLDEGLVLRGGHEQSPHDVDQRRDADDRAQVEGEIAGARPVVGPADAQPHAVVDDERADDQEKRGDSQLRAANANRRAAILPFRHPSPLPGAEPPVRPYFPAMKPAFFISAMCRASSRATQSAYSLPASVVLLNAPSSISFCHSGVAITFLNSST